MRLGIPITEQEETENKINGIESFRMDWKAMKMNS